MQSLHVRFPGKLVSLVFGRTLTALAPAICRAAALLDVSKATVVVRSGMVPPAERTAARVLVEEVNKRTGLNWPISTVWPKHGALIAISSGGDPAWPGPQPRREGKVWPENQPEGFRLTVQERERGTTV